MPLSQISRGARRALAAGITVVMLTGPLFAQPEGAPEGKGVIRGHLYLSDGKTRLAGARATAVNVTTSKPYSSAETSENGAYEITGLPGGSYDLVIELTAEVFVADNLVDLRPSETVTLSFAVEPRRPANRMVPGMGRPTGSAVLQDELRAAPAAGGRTFWSGPGGLAILGALSLGVGYLIGDEDGSPSSP
jgi:hypothetical protein